MLLHTDHLKPGMHLERDIELCEGSYLITCAEVEKTGLTDSLIDSIRKFGKKIVPGNNTIWVMDDEVVLESIRKVLSEDFDRIVESIQSGTKYVNFLAGEEFKRKTLRVIEIILSNGSIAKKLYNTRFESSEAVDSREYILDHGFRVALLAIALGLKLRLTILSLTSLCIAALFHDLGILTTPPYPDLVALDQLFGDKIDRFVKQHAMRSALWFMESDININPCQKSEVLEIIANHHNPDTGPDESLRRNARVFKIADIVDEMVSPGPHRLRYNFTSAQIRRLGESFRRQTGLVGVLLGLAKLYKDTGGYEMEIIEATAELFDMKALVNNDFELELQKILDDCPFKSAKVYPEMNGNSLPRNFFCSRSVEKGFSCDGFASGKAVFKDNFGKPREFAKCRKLEARFRILIALKAHDSRLISHNTSK